MNEPDWTTELRRHALKTRRMILEPGNEQGQIALTKIGGVPWWPKDLARPKCGAGHDLAFMAQVLLGNAEQLAPDSGLLSFHYCEECTANGRMSWGRGDGGYDVRIFSRSAHRQPDGRGEIAHSSMPSRRVTLVPVDEVPGYEDIEEDLRNRIPRNASTAKDDLDENVYKGLVHVKRCKVGGWPSWVQSPSWPECPKSGRMMFVAQLDWHLGRDTSWAGGGYAYLFACPDSCGTRQAELVIQTI